MPDRNGKIFYTSITSLSHISKCAGIHRFAVRLAEQVVILVNGFVRGLLPIPLAFFPPRLEQLTHLFAQIHHAVTAAGLRVFRDGLLVAQLHDSALYMNRPFAPVDVTPF